MNATTVLFWSVVAGVIVWVGIALHEAGNRIDRAEHDSQAYDLEYESARRRHPSYPKPMGLDDWGNDKPVTLFGRQVYSEDDVTQEEWQAMFDAINTRLMDEVTKDKGEQA